MKVVAIIQARMGSTRLPGKVLLDLAGRPMLARVVRRAGRAATLDQTVVATTDRREDDAIEQLCLQAGWACFRGSESDVLDRYHRAATTFEAGAVVRLTADCPLIAPDLIDAVVTSFLAGQPHLHYASNVNPLRTYPRGLDTEVIRRDALERAWREDADPAWREHVTPYIYRHAELFRLHNLTNDVDYSFMRWTVDTPEDLALVRRVYDRFADDAFSWRDVAALMKREPALSALNQGVRQKAL